MIIVQLYGGFGNQMFQFAIGLYLSQKFGTELKIYLKKKEVFRLDCFGIEEIEPTSTELFKIKGFNETSLLNKLLNFLNYSRNVISEKNNIFNEEVLKTKARDIFLKGYWQNEKYFKEISNLIREKFTFNDEIRWKIFENKEKLIETNSVSLHVRRGDYLYSINMKELGLCSLEYYEKAIEFIVSKVENPHFFIFSDDIAWCKKNLKLKFPTFYIKGNKNFEDMYLMSLCKNNIIANSSFSWWGAWLNNNDDKIVIAPKRWFASEEKGEISPVPESWVKL